MNRNEEDENLGAQRAGGNVSAKSPGHKSDDSQAEETNTAPAHDSEPGTRAGGPVITKGPSQKQPESSQ